MSFIIHLLYKNYPLRVQKKLTTTDYNMLDPELKDSEELKLLVEFYYQGYTIKELADQRGISIGACKMRIKRAKEHLRKKLE